MLRLLKNTTFSTAVDRASDIIENFRTIFKTSDTRLLDAMCDVKTDGKIKSRNGSGEKIIPSDPEHRN